MERARAADSYGSFIPFLFQPPHTAPTGWQLDRVKESLLHHYELPTASESEFLIEKTPMYSRVNSIRRRVLAISAAIPKVKIFLFLCDPVERLYSHLKHCIREKYQGDDYTHFHCEKMFFWILACAGQKIGDLVIKISKLFEKLDLQG